MSTPTLALNKSRRLSPLAALLWEEWRQTRVPLLIGTLLAALAALGLVRAHLPLIVGAALPQKEEEPRGLAIGIVVLLFCWQAATLLFSGYGRNDLTLQFPRRLFALPLNSITLALTRLGYGLAVVAVTFSLLGWLTSTSSADPSWHTYPFNAMLGLLYVEALAWLLGRRPIIAVAVGLVLWIPFAVWYQDLIEAERLLPLSVTLIGRIPAAVILASVAIYAVSVQRSGRWVDFGGLERIRGIRTGARASQKALFRFEWHRRGRWVALTSIAGLILIVLVNATQISVNWNYPFALYGTFATVAVAGLMQIILSERDRVSGIERFLVTRPASTLHLAKGRLKALAAGWCVAYVVFASLFMYYESYRPSRWNGILMDFSPIEFAGHQKYIQSDRSFAGKHRPVYLYPAYLGRATHVAPRTSKSLEPPIAGTSPSSPTVGRVSHVPHYHRGFSLKYTPAVKPSLIDKCLRELSYRYGDITGPLPALVVTFLMGWLILTQPLLTLFIVSAFIIIMRLADQTIERGEMPWLHTFMYAGLALGVIGVTIALFGQVKRLGLIRKRTLLWLVGAWIALTCFFLLTFAMGGATPRQVFGLRIPLLGGALVLAASALPLWPFLNLPLAIHRRRHQ